MLTDRRPGSGACWNTPPTCLIARPLRRWGRGSSGCSKPRWRTPQRAIGSLDILELHERVRLLRDWNDTEHAVEEASLPALFAAQAQRTPDAVAVVFEDRSLSYAELEAHANQLAHHLQSLGVGPETVVGLCVERSPEMVIGLLGILKAGGAYLPLDPDYPAERLAFMLPGRRRHRAGDPVGADRSLARPRCRRTAAPASCGSMPTGPPSHASPPPRQSSNCTRSTPPTSSTPQAQPEPQKASSSAMVVSSTIRLGPVKEYRPGFGSGAPLLTPLAFDATVTSLFLPLLSGKQVLLLQEDKQLEILASDKSGMSNFSLLKVTPAHVDALNQLAPNEGFNTLSHRIIIGGETLTAATVESWLRHAPHARLINEYGPTETVVGCTVHEVSSDDLNKATIPIGRPIWNTRVYVLDCGLEPVPCWGFW